MLEMVVFGVIVLIVAVSYKIIRTVEDADDLSVGINSKGDKWL